MHIYNVGGQHRLNFKLDVSFPECSDLALQEVGYFSSVNLCRPLCLPVCIFPKVLTKTALTCQTVASKTVVTIGLVHLFTLKQPGHTENNMSALSHFDNTLLSLPLLFP